MLIYLDANIVQYCADYADLICGGERGEAVPNVKLKAELLALREIVEVALRAEEQDLDHRWDVAAPRHLLDELLRGKPTSAQLEIYSNLQAAWEDLGVESHGEASAQLIGVVSNRLKTLNLHDAPDRRHLAEAIAMGAKWFLTLDEDILRKTRDKETEPGRIEDMIVVKPSELRAKTAFDPVFGLRLRD